MRIDTEPGRAGEDCPHHCGEHRPRVLLVDELSGDAPCAGTTDADTFAAAFRADVEEIGT